MKKQMTNICIFFLLVLFFLVLAPTVEAAEPKYGGIVRIGVLFPQFNHLGGRKWIPLGYVPATRMIYDPILQWGTKNSTNLPSKKILIWPLMTARLAAILIESGLIKGVGL